MELFKLFGSIAIDNTKAKDALNETTTEAKKSADETESAFEKIGGVASKIALGIGAAGVAIGGAFIGAVESTREYRQQMGLLDSAFQTAGHSSEVAKQTYSDLNAVLGDTGQAVEASQHLAKLVDNEKDLQTWTDICTGVYATFGESLPIEGLTEAANETSKTGILTGGLTDALNWAGISEETFQEKLDKCTNEQERQKLIMDTLNDTYSKASEQYKETNADVIESQKAQERLSDAMAEVGAVGEPIMTAVKNAIASMAEKAVPVIESMIAKFKDMVTWVKNNEDTIHKWVAVILGATVAISTFLLILNWSKIMTAAANAIKVVRTAILAMNAAMLANPIGLIVALLAGLVVAFIYLWNNVEGFRKFWITTWNNIKSIASSTGKAISKFFSEAWSSIKSTFSSLGSWFKSLFQSAWSNIKSVFSGWGSFFSGLWTQIKSKFSSIGTSIGSSMGKAVRSGLNSVISIIESTINKGIGLINSAIKLANKLPAVNVGTVPKLSLPRLARGGVVDEATTAVIGEEGTEAIVPLENNTRWIDKVAERLNMNTSNQEKDTKLDRIISLLDQLLTRNIYLDTGVLVGELAPAMDVSLSEIYNRTNRGNTR